MGDALEEIAWSWAAAVNERDAAALVAISAPDIECVPLQIGLTGHYHGHEGIRRWMDELTTDDIGHKAQLDYAEELSECRVGLFGAIFLEGRMISPYSLVIDVVDGKVGSARSFLADEGTLRDLKLLG